MKIKNAINIEDLRQRAKARLPRMVFDYIDGGADDEVTLRRSVARFDDYELTGHVLRDVSNIDLRTQILGHEYSAPFIISPTAASRLFHPRQGERAVATAAASSGILYCASTLASVKVEDIHDRCPAPKWFQVYVWKDRALVEKVLERVKASGFTTLVLTVDTPVAGNRERDPRNGFSIPPKVTFQTATQALLKPEYLFQVFSTPEIGPANFPVSGNAQNIAEFINTQFDPSVTWEYATWLKSVWDGPVLIKGISRVDDAEHALQLGMDGVWISNHGGRQLDVARPTIDILPEVRAAIGDDAFIVFDGGIRRGSHVFKALALGADIVAIGRAYLYGLAAAGSTGVEQAIDILSSELKRTMALTGVKNVCALRVTGQLVSAPRFV